jgi:hypothetical protein
MNFSCPEACCGLGGPTSNDIVSFTGERMVFGHCEGEEDIRYEAYYIIGRRDSTISAEQLATQGTPCDVQRYEFLTGFPKIVTTIDCSAVWAGVDDACDERQATLGILVGAVGEENLQYFDETVMPYTNRIRGENRVCPKELKWFISCFVIALVALSVVVFLWCVYLDKVKPCCSRQCRRSVQEDESPVSTSSVDPKKFSNSNS